ncbi:MAG: hypothetical protein HW387_330 [Parachlamydiales bacterium]|nr:hypothetical protein [Parachlamydiales bacterium]
MKTTERTTPFGSLKPLCYEMFQEIHGYLDPKEGYQLAFCINQKIIQMFSDQAEREQKLLLKKPFTAILLEPKELSEHLQTLSEITLREIKGILEKSPLQFYAYLNPVLIQLREDLIKSRNDTYRLMNISMEASLTENESRTIIWMIQPSLQSKDTSQLGISRSQLAINQRWYAKKHLLERFPHATDIKISVPTTAKKSFCTIS